MIDAGIYDAERMEVKSGLSPEDQVITTWSNELNDGAEVLVKNDDASAGTTEATAETTASLKNLVEAAKELRNEN